MKKIVINIIATNKYISFLDELINTINLYLFKNSNLTLLIHTNMELNELIQKYKNDRIDIIKNHIEHEPWPNITLKRFHYFLMQEQLINEHDYCFYIDTDCILIDVVDETIIPQKGLLGTIHGILFNGPGTPERNPRSTAYIPKSANNRYYIGGFYGGSSDSFTHMSKTIKSNIDIDLSKNIIAIWHDESHINRYFYDNPPVITLDNFLFIGEQQLSDYPHAKIIHLDKSTRGGHKYFRDQI